MAFEYRIVEQDPAFKVLSRSYLWKDETRQPGTAGYDAARVVQIYGTDESVDSYNTILRVDGWDFARFAKNPAFLWSHNMDPAVPTMPVGHVTGIQREEFARAEGGAANKRLLFDVEFPKRGTYAWADLVCDMYKQGHLRASSVGFSNLERKELNAKHDKEEMEKAGFDLKKGWAGDLLRNSLNELSAVPIGSNPNALVKAMRAAVPDEFRGLIEGEGDEITDAWLTPRLEALRDALTPKEDEDDDQDWVEEVVPPACDDCATLTVEARIAEHPRHDDAFEHELEKAVAAQEQESLPQPFPVLIPTPRETFETELRQQLKEMRDELKALLRRLARGATPTAR